MNFSRLTLIILLFFSALDLAGQINVITGYDGGYTEANSYNDILNRYNLSQDSIQESYGDFNFLNGITLGLSYRIEDISIEALWIERNSQVTVNGINPETGRSFTNDIENRMRTISVGLNAHLRNFIIGGTINADLLRINYDTNTMERINVSRQSEYSSRLYAGFFVRANQALSISLRPYVQIPWGSFNLNDLDETINGTRTNTQEDFMHFGISLFLYNGAQNNQRYY